VAELLQNPIKLSSIGDIK